MENVTGVSSARKCRDEESTRFPLFLPLRERVTPLKNHAGSSARARVLAP